VDRDHQGGPGGSGRSCGQLAHELDDSGGRIPRCARKDRLGSIANIPVILQPEAEESSRWIVMARVALVGVGDHVAS
jgi:hypothetical protein